MTESRDCCDLCHQPILPDEPVHGAYESRHWDCHEKRYGKRGQALREFKESVEQMRLILDDIDRVTKAWKKDR